jgi:hypothetical protein
MHYRVIRLRGSLLLGQRCGLLHSPHLNARKASAETLWCTNCWADLIGEGRGTLIVPFYLYYRHFDTHVLSYIPPCRNCDKRFQVWDADEALKEGHTHLFSAYTNPTLLSQVEALVKNGSRPAQ